MADLIALAAPDALGRLPLAVAAHQPVLLVSRSRLIAVEGEVVHGGEGPGDTDIVGADLIGCPIPYLRG